MPQTAAFLWILAFLQIFTVFQNDLRLRNGLLEVCQTYDTGFSACCVIGSFFHKFCLVLDRCWKLSLFMHTFWLVVNMWLLSVASLFQRCLRCKDCTYHLLIWLLILYFRLKLILEAAQTAISSALSVKCFRRSNVVDYYRAVVVLVDLVPSAKCILRCWYIIIGCQRLWPCLCSLIEALFGIVWEHFLNVFVCKFIHAMILFQSVLIAHRGVLGAHLAQGAGAALVILGLWLNVTNAPGPLLNIKCIMQKRMLFLLNNLVIILYHVFHWKLRKHISSLVWEVLLNFLMPDLILAAAGGWQILVWELVDIWGVHWFS